MFRMAQLHGVEAIRGFMAYLKDYRDHHPSPATAEDKEDLHIEALAAGAHLNLSCYADAWRWQASSDLRSRMDALYGVNNPFCADTDQDTFRPLTGDCRDDQPGIHPGAVETANGTDDDCNGVVDDLLVSEPAGSDFPDFQPIGFPGRIQGNITENDVDKFSIEIAQPQKIAFRLCSDPDFQGFLMIYNQDGAWTDFAYDFKGGCVDKTFDFTAARTWQVGVEFNADSLPGHYTLQYGDPEEWPRQWGTVSSLSSQSCSFPLSATTQSLAGVSPDPDTVRLWVDGVGFVATLPYASTVRYDWVPPVSIEPGTYGYRAQLYQGNLPVSDATAPVWFTVAGGSDVGFSSSDQTFGSLPGNGTVGIQSDGGCPWTVGVDVPWIQLASAETGAGSQPLKFAVQDNPTHSTRTGTIRAGNAALSITQWGKLDPITLTAPNGGEQFTLHQPLTVQWTPLPGSRIARYDASVSYDDGLTYQPIPACANLQDPARSECDWQPSGPASSLARIRVAARDSFGETVQDDSDAAFTLLPDNQGIDLGFISRMLQVYVGNQSATVEDLARGDVLPKPGTEGRLRGDGQIRGDDLNRLLRFYLGLVHSL
jgi:hypothetical protein